MTIRQRLNKIFFCSFWGCEPAGEQDLELTFEEQLARDSGGVATLVVMQPEPAKCQNCGRTI